MNDAPLAPADFAFVAKVLREECALVLEPGKEYLVKARLAPVARRHGLAGVGQLVDRLRAERGGGMMGEVVEAMVTTETSFFRDVHPFEALRTTILPALVERRRAVRQLNVWCAASSSGQEPYSIALLIKEHFPELNAWRVNFWATDVSQEMLQRSEAGKYSQLEVNRGLPATLLVKWFSQEGTHWRIDPRVRESIKFLRVNLAQPWPTMPTWDLVFLRNVMIYFDNETKKSILGRVAAVLARDGYLVLGGAETTLALDDSYVRVEPFKSGYYQRKST